MQESKIKTLSDIRRDAALKRWDGHTAEKYITIRIKESVKTAVDRLPGHTISDKINALLLQSC